MTHHSKPAEAVACLYTVQGDSQPFMRISRGMLHVAGDIVAVQPLGPLPATPAPAAGGLEAVRGALVEAEAAFEAIRIILVNELEEPVRGAFWRAVQARDASRAALAAAAASRGEDWRPVLIGMVAAMNKRDSDFGDGEIPSAHRSLMWRAEQLLASPAATRGEPVAWMRRWAYDGIDVMAMKKEDRPRGWGMLATALGKLFDDDVALYASPPAPAVESAQVKAWTDVLAERRRQVEAEGWTPEHDDEHDKGEMAGAAAVYALHGATYKPWQPPEPKGFEAVREAREEASKSLGTLKSALASMRAKNPAPPRYWPWHIDWWKPASRRRNLVKAGALILAEIERLDRASLATDAEG